MSFANFMDEMEAENRGEVLRNPAYLRGTHGEPNETALRESVRAVSTRGPLTGLHRLPPNVQSVVSAQLGYKGKSFKNALQKLNRERAEAEREAAERSERERKAFQEWNRARLAAEAAVRQAAAAAEAAEAERIRRRDAAIIAEQLIKSFKDKAVMNREEARRISRARRGVYSRSIKSLGKNKKNASLKHRK